MLRAAFARWVARQVQVVNIGPIWTWPGDFRGNPIEVWRAQVLSDRAYCTWAEEWQPSFRSYCDVDLRGSFARFAMQELGRINHDLGNARRGRRHD